MNFNITDFISAYCQTIQGCLQGLYNLGVALAVMVAFFMFLFGAFRNLLSTVPDIKLEGKTIMRNSIIGLVVIFLSGVILYWINPYIFDPRITIYRVTKLAIDVEITTTTKNLIINGNNFNLPIEDINLGEDLSNRPCIGDKKIIRTTVYYVPLGNEEENKHKFLSNVTLQGKGIIQHNNQLKVLNYLNAKEILATSALPGRNLDRCRDGWHWSWIAVTGNRQRGCSLAKTSQRESTNYYDDVLNRNSVETLSLALSSPLTGPLRGAYGPIIRGKTAARDKNSSFFEKNQAVKILRCLNNREGSEVNCGIKNNVFIITDTGGGGEDWLDLFGGIGEAEKNEFSNQKTDWAEVCVVGKVNLK